MAHASYGNHSPTPDSKLADNQPVGQSGDAPPFDLESSNTKEKPPSKDLPAAGPHGKPELTNEDATPGAGSLPDAGDKDATDSTSG